MSDKLISQFDEGIPASADWLLYEDANTAGSYKKVKRANVGSGSGSVGVTLTTPTLSVSVASSSSINLSWTNVSGESSFQVQQSLNNTTWTTIATPGANSTALTVSGLSASTLYYFRVKAVGDGSSFLDSGYGTGSGTTASGAGDTTAPTIVSRTVIASDKIRVVYNEAMGSPSAAGHQFIVDGSPFTPTSATSFNSTTVDYVLATTMTSGSVVTHGYSLQPTGAGTRDVAGNQLAGFSGASVTNSLGGGSTWTKKAGVTMTTNVGGYWEYLPTSYSPSGTKIPVIIAWHGGGAQGTGSSADLNALLNEGVPQQINAEGFSYQSVVICPQYTGGAPSASMIEAVIDYVVANYNVEPTKVHMTGLSFGGAILGNWAVTGTIAKVASISVLCNYFDVNSTAVTRLKAAGMPIRLYHGDADSVAPVTNSRNWFNSLNAATAIVPATEKYEIVGAEHNIWTDVYPSSVVFGGKNWAQWHMEQQRGDADALDYIAKASVSAGAHSAAVDTFVTGLKSAGLWSKMRAFYPLYGTSYATAKFNLKDRANTDAAGRLVEIGTFSYASDGATITSSASGDRLSTKILDTDAFLGQDDITLFVASKTNVAELKIDIGSSAGSSPLYIVSRNSGDVMWGAAFCAYDGSGVVTSSIGRFYLARTGASAWAGYKNGSSLFTSSVASTTRDGKEISLFNIESGSLHSTKKLTAAGVFKGLTSGEIATLDGLVSTFLTAIGHV